jgi:hypothetical protein
VSNTSNFDELLASSQNCSIKSHKSQLLCVAKLFAIEYNPVMGTKSIEEALQDLAEIRSSLSRAETFRGYRSSSTFATSMVAWLGCVLQARSAGSEQLNLTDYLSFWVPVGVVCSSLHFGEVLVRYWRSGPHFRHMTRSAVAPMVPALLTGLMLTIVIGLYASEVGWMLPGLWAMVFGLGVAASARFLPRLLGLVAFYFVLSGLACVALSANGWVYSPWLMGFTFGFGQMLSAILLYWTLERRT